MIDNCYTFKELCEKYNWTSTAKGIPGQIIYAKNHGILMERAFKKGSTYYKIIDDNYITYTFKELCNKYNWDCTIQYMSTQQRIDFAKGKGVIIEDISKSRYKETLFIIKEHIKPNDYTIKDLENKYNWNFPINTTEKIIQYAANKGVILERLTYLNKPLHFYIKDESLYNAEWIDCSVSNSFEVTKLGFVRNKKTKKIYMSPTSTFGYIQIVDPDTKGFLLAHRMIMETFNPIENAQRYVVDHINGIKTDNRLENLQWLTNVENVKKSGKDRFNINTQINELISINGYEETSKILAKLLENLKNK